MLEYDEHCSRRAHKISPRESFSVVVSFNLSLDVKHSRREVCHPISGVAISRSAETAKHVGDISLTLRGERRFRHGGGGGSSTRADIINRFDRTTLITTPDENVFISKRLFSNRREDGCFPHLFPSIIVSLKASVG